MKKLGLLISLLCGMGFASLSAQAATNPISVDVGGTTFVLPLQKVNGTQLYSFRDKVGYPGVETVIAGWGHKNSLGDFPSQFTFGAAPVLGQSKNVPFVAVQTKLPSRFFDTSNNALVFGVWIGKESHVSHATYGIKGSINFW